MDNPPIKQNITATLEENYMPYAMSVIISRAIPEIDGFKPSHRKLLYTMYKMGLINGARTKSANVVGQTMKLNPHGDMAIYETMVRMTRANGALLYPYVDSKGNFGKQYSRDMAFAAARYTEVKLEDICRAVFTDIDKDTVEFQDNYDATMKEPVMLPVAFPAILANPNQGIAVGMASNICSFNMGELCETASQLIKDPETDIMDTLKAPDFPTGGYIIYNRDEMRQIYETGRGSFKIRSKYKYDKKNNCIEVYEIPYTTTCEAIIDKLIELIKANKIKEISDIRDETDLNGLKLTLDLKKGVDPDKLMTKLYKVTPFEDSFGCNFNILINGVPRVMGIKEILNEWTLFRAECVKRGIAFDIKKKSEKLHLLLGLKKILLDIDKAIRIIRNTEDDDMVVPNLMSGFGIDELQAEFVAEIKLRNLNKQYIIKRTDEVDSLTEEIKKLEDIYKSDRKVRSLIVKELGEISKKYGSERKSEIISGGELADYKEEQFIEDYNLKILLTKDNYFKKISLVSLRSASEQKIKEGDKIIAEFDSVNRADLILFTDKQNVYKARLYEMNDCKASSWGEYLPNVLSMETDEKVLYMVPTENYKGNMIFAFENGKIAKVPLEAYMTKQNRKKLMNAFSDKSPVAGILYTEEDTDIVTYSNAGKRLVLNTDKIPLKTTRNTQGVFIMKLKKGSKMNDMKLLAESGLENPESYRARNLPSSGYYDKEESQISIF